MFHEDWFSPESCVIVGVLAAKTAPLPGRVVEVGCWEGRSTVAIANAVAPATVHAVDTWAGSPGEESATLAETRDVYAQFVANVATLTDGNVAAHRTDWRTYFATDRTPIRFLHIDAEHTYREVRDNIEAALDLMVPGGVICGDDRHHPPVIEAARDTLGDVTAYASLWVKEIT